MTNKHDNAEDAQRVVTPQDLAALGAPQLVYIREVPASEVLAQEPIPGLDVEPDAIWYAVHAADGSRLAVLDDREAAFDTAREHQLKPVSVH